MEDFSKEVRGYSRKGRASYLPLPITKRNTLNTFFSGRGRGQLGCQVPYWNCLSTRTLM